MLSETLLGASVGLVGAIIGGMIAGRYSCRAVREQVNAQEQLQKEEHMRQTRNIVRRYLFAIETEARMAREVFMEFQQEEEWKTRASFYLDLPKPNEQFGDETRFLDDETIGHILITRTILREADSILRHTLEKNYKSNPLVSCAILATLWGVIFDRAKAVRAIYKIEPQDKDIAEESERIIRSCGRKSEDTIRRYMRDNPLIGVP